MSSTVVARDGALFSSVQLAPMTPHGHLRMLPSTRSVLRLRLSIELACTDVAHSKARAALSLASVGDGMAAGAAFAHPRAAYTRVPIRYFTHTTI